jgi:hypothetical protein
LRARSNALDDRHLEDRGKRIQAFERPQTVSDGGEMTE